MHFRAVAFAALWASASHVAAQAPKLPYKLDKVALMPVLGMSLARRDTNGYQPEQTVCGDGNTCAEACGEGFTTCPSNDDSTHCYNPTADQSCCTDGTGNSCDKGYYCTHDTSLQTWCCPDEMDLVQCAAAYGVTGGLETPEATTSTPTPTPTPTVVTTSSTSTSTTTSTLFTPVTTSTSTSTTTSTSTRAVTKTKTTTEVVEKTTEVCASSSGYTTAWTGSNSTISTAVPTQPSESTPVSITVVPTVVPTGSTSGASAMGFSALILAAAGVVALL